MISTFKSTYYVPGSVPISQMRQLRHRAIEQPTQGHTAHLIPVYMAPQPMLLTTTL